MREDEECGPIMTPDALHWECLSFAALSPENLYALLKLRGEVFVVEQACAYLDPDGLDPRAFHWMAWSGDTLLAYQRCLPPGTSYVDASSIGRIVVAMPGRGSAVGRELVRRGIAFNRREWPGYPIRIGAQSYLENFYHSLGFVSGGDYYLEDGIEHVHMSLDA